MKGALRIVTIGGYGFTADAFVCALRTEAVGVFVDLRARRGMRGARYAFLNSTRLQALLSAEGIRYVHMKELSPPPEARALQRAEDSRLGVRKRMRGSLAPGFVAAYRRMVLGAISPSAFLSKVVPGERTLALFCVEGAPEACHRLLVAEWLSERLNAQVVHIRPPMS